MGITIYIVCVILKIFIKASWCIDKCGLSLSQQNDENMLMLKHGLQKYVMHDELYSIQSPCMVWLQAG